MSIINSSETRGIQVIEVTGRIDADSARDVGRALDAAVDGGHTKLVLDLGSVDYISSAGLREIVRIYKRVQPDGDLRLATPSERVMDVLQLAGLDTMLQIFATQTQAINSY